MDEEEKSSVTEDGNTDMPKIVQDLSFPLKGTIDTIEADVQLMETIEGEINKQLVEKAEKTNLTVSNVKSIIRQVLTNEHVLSLLHKEDNTSLPEPKLTRAKTKELFSSHPVQVPNSWAPPPPPSEIHALVTEELSEDSSGDEEYTPGDEEETEDSIASESDTSSLPPPTPPSAAPVESNLTDTSWTEDGVFKIPPIRCTPKKENLDVANIALRTRSKINLSSTPLEVIEKSFMPPDITTDMYDMECDDEEWKEFLQGFTEPLETVTKPRDDEDYDPEYNILAEYDEIEKVDRIDRKEEFRDDKAVTITKKELKELWEELFEYIQNLSEDHGNKQEEEAQTSQADESTFLETSTLFMIEKSDSRRGSGNETQKTENLNSGTNNDQTEILPSTSLFEHMGLSRNILDSCVGSEVNILTEQICILEQQIRQHVQMLAQNFLLMYEHPEFHHYCLQIKEYLLNFKYLGQGKTCSLFNAVNLESAIKLVDSWIDLFKANGSEVEACKSLLAFGIDHFTNFFEKQQNRNVKNKYGNVPISAVVSCVHQYMMPHRSEDLIRRHVRICKDSRCANNPIRQYFMHKKLSKMIHYIYSIETRLPPYKRSADELPTQMRNFLFANKKAPPATAPILIQTSSAQPIYLLSSTPISVESITVPIKPKAKGRTTLEATPEKQLSKAKQRKSYRKQKRYEKCSTSIEKFDAVCSKRIPLRKLVKFFSHKETQLKMSSGKGATLKQIQTVCKSTDTDISGMNAPSKRLQETALPDSHVSTTLNNPKSLNDALFVLEKQAIIVDRKDSQDFSYICSSNFQQAHVSTEVEFCNMTNSFHISQVTLQHNEIRSHDTPIHEKIEAAKSSSMGKPTTKKEKGPQPSRAEKRKAKFKREFLANLSVTVPEDPNCTKQKGEMFAFAFYDKMRETLELEDYHKLMKVLNDFELGDAVDLYKKVEPILKTKYDSLAEEFLMFLREKEAAALGLLIPWIKVHSRSKFLRKIEIYFKDQPNQVKRIYNALTELSGTENVSIEKIKSCVLPLLKGNGILTEVFLQNLLCERPPPSLLNGPYETIDVNKELARAEGEDIYETMVVPNIEDKYGGQNCMCHCHTIEDSLYKSRFKHCTSCGLRFVNGQIFVQSGRSMQPATVTFGTNPKANHNSRLLSKLSTASHTSHRSYKRKPDVSPNKQASGTKENLDEDTEDDDKARTKKKCTLKTSRKCKKVGEPSSSTPKMAHQRETKPKKSSNYFKRHRIDKKKSTLKVEELSCKVTKDDKHNAKSTDKKKKPERCEQKQIIRYLRNRKKSNGDEIEKPIVAGDYPEEPKYYFQGILNQPVSDFEYVSKVSDNVSSLNSNEPTQGESNKELQTESDTHFSFELSKADESSNRDLNTAEEFTEKLNFAPIQQTAESESESQDATYESDSSNSSSISNIPQNGSNTNNGPPWKREEDTIILETFQQEDDKDYALQIICDKLPNRTISHIRSRFSTLMALLIQTLKHRR